jgi:hypothetical protein
MTECPRCSQPVNAGFRVCPYCSARLGGEPLSAPTMRTAERQGKRDTTLSGFGIVILGIVGFLGAVLALLHRRGGEPGEIAFAVGVGAILVVLAGSMIAGFGIRGRKGAAAGLAGGCGSVALGLGLGALLFLAALIFMFVGCLAAVAVR